MQEVLRGPQLRPSATSAASTASSERPALERDTVPMRTDRGSHRMIMRTSAILSDKLRQQPLELVFRNLSFTVESKTQKVNGKKERKVILDNLDGMFRSGRLTAIMGPSGAGKTSLLDCIAGNLLGGQISGEILVNGEDYSGKRIKDISGFVFQDDVLLETMTVREAIEQSALLRLPKTVGAEERRNRVEDIIALLHLEGCQNTRIGSPLRKGISGGERKRTAAAMELIANPPMLFLDEPTSGLDTFTAYTVVKSLKRLAKQGRTVIATIHQPSSEIFHLFDDLLLLSEGHIVYLGDAEASIEYFDKLGYQCPVYSNPADFYFMEMLRQFSLPKNIPPAPPSASAQIERLAESFATAGSTHASQAASATSCSVHETSSDQETAGEEALPMGTHSEGQGEAVDREEAPSSGPQGDEADEAESIRNRIEYLRTAWLESEENRKLHESMDNGNKEGVAIGTLRKRAPFPRQFWFLLKRASKNAIRNPLIVFIGAFRAVFFGLLVGLLYLNSNQYSINVQVRNKSGAIFFLALNTFFASTFGVLTVFYTEKQVFFREYRAGYYGTTAYFFSKFLVEVPYAFIFPYLMVIIAYYMVGLNPPFSDYLLSATFVAVASICGVGVGVLIASIFDDLNVILAVTPAVLLPLLLLSGIFVAAGSIPGFLTWIRYISPIYYSSTGMLQVEFSRDFPGCNQTVNGSCAGSQAFDQLGAVKPLPIGVNMALDLTLWVTLVLAAYLVLGLLTRIKYTSS